MSFSRSRASLWQTLEMCEYARDLSTVSAVATHQKRKRWYSILSVPGDGDADYTKKKYLQALRKDL